MKYICLLSLCLVPSMHRPPYDVRAKGTNVSGAESREGRCLDPNLLLPPLGVSQPVWTHGSGPRLLLGIGSMAVEGAACNHGDKGCGTQARFLALSGQRSPLDNSFLLIVLEGSRELAGKVTFLAFSIQEPGKESSYAMNLS